MNFDDFSAMKKKKKKKKKGFEGSNETPEVSYVGSCSFAYTCKKNINTLQKFEIRCIHKTIVIIRFIVYITSSEIM